MAWSPPLHAGSIQMEVLTAKTARRSTRLRVEIPVSVTSLDRRRPFSENCMLLVVSAQGCGFRSPRALQLETPIMLSGLPDGSSVTAWVANCLPLGEDGQQFLIGVALYTHGNVWGIANPPDDWKLATDSVPSPKPSKSKTAKGSGALTVKKQQWPYNLIDEPNTIHTNRK